ncbi:MAG: hypothetical protein LQ340_002313 [Diploschistes diacapsis]|nr:MAG: hypothetical protein LQ340_002313 [Diploschistes diacapsis]
MATFQPPNAGQLFGEHNIPSRSYHTSFPHHQSSSLPVQSLETAGPSNHVQGSHEVASQCENMDNHPTQELWNHLNSTAIPKTPSKTSKKKYVPPSKAKKFTKDPEKARKAPEPVAQYLLRARRPMQNAQQPKTLLIVLDLNGTLLERMWGSNRVIMRPYIDSFLKYCFGNHRVMIWSSAQPANVRNMCVKVFNAADRAMLVAMWGRDKLDLSSEDYADRVQVFKRLEKIWEDQELQREHPQAGSGGSWNQTNTVLIDDSVFKAASQPHNLIEIPEFLKEHMRKELKGKILEQVTAYLETARKYEDVSTFIEKNPFRMGESTLLKASGSSTGQLPDKKT